MQKVLGGLFIAYNIQHKQTINLYLQNWEDCFLDDEYSQAINNFMELWSNRDVVVRAAALQLVTGMIISPRIAARLTEGTFLTNHLISLIIQHDYNFFRS